MAFSEADRVLIRQYLGFSGLYLHRNDNRLLESVITSVQARADGGSYQDSSTETQIKAILADLVALEAKLKALWDQAQAMAAGSLRLDVPRASAMLRSEGRRLVSYLSAHLNVAPKRDVFSAAPPRVDDVQR